MIEPTERSPEEHSPKATQSRRRMLLLVGGLLVLFSCLCTIAFFFLAQSATELEEARSVEFDVLYGVCESGAPTAGAAPYTGVTGLHPIMIVQMDGDGNMSRNFISYPREWQPNRLGQTALVACIEPQQAVLLESCENQVERYQYTLEATLHDAQSGKKISQELFLGSPPLPCEEEVLFEGEQQAIPSYGKVVDDDEIEDWLRSYVIKE